MIKGKVVSVSKNEIHSFSKITCAKINLIKDLGVEGDAHMGTKVKHRSRVAQNPDQPNLRQVHLMHQELFKELAQKGFEILNGELGENITTEGIDLLGLPRDTLLRVGETSVIKITGLRNPCSQIDLKQKGLMKAVLDKDQDGNLIRKAGIMGVVVEGGVVNIGDSIFVELPAKPHIKLERV